MNMMKGVEMSIMLNILVVLIGVFINSQIERHFKENWVIRSTMEKTIKMLL